jgi:hypothetical protein
MTLKLKKLTFVTMSAMLSMALLVGCGDEEENPEDPATEDPATEEPAGQEDTEETDDTGADEDQE